MNTVRLSTHALRKLTVGNKIDCRSFTQQGVTQAQNKSKGWAIPSALAVVGLGLSTFSTQQLVSGCDTAKMLSPNTGKQ